MTKILIDEYELRSMVADAVNDAVDKITKKIAAKCAQASYNNEIFREPSGYSCGNSGSCGRSGGCGVSSYSSRSYNGGCGSSGGC